MISKATIKKIHSLAHKKYRQELGVFVAEGQRTVDELSRVVPPVVLYSGEDANRASLLQHPQGVLALFPINMFERRESSSSLQLAVDGVQDPGNMGTILRIADWFGIDMVYCSMDTVDVFNPKVVQATMGAIAHVKVAYDDLEKVLDSLPSSIPIYGATLDGENIYHERLSQEGVIVVGNEGNGIRPGILKRLTHRLLIPAFAAGREHVESLNVAVATAIVCAEFRRL